MMKLFNAVRIGWAYCKGFTAGIVAFLLLILGIVMYDDRYQLKYKDSKKEVNLKDKTD